MELIPATDAPAMDKALRDFERAHWAELPARIQEEIDRRRGPSPDFVGLFCNVAEMLWAEPAARSAPATKTILGQLAYFCGANGWHGWRDGRGLAVQRAMARELGESPPDGTPWPTPEEDPPVDEAFAPPPPEESAEAVA